MITIQVFKARLLNNNFYDISLINILQITNVKTFIFDFYLNSQIINTTMEKLILLITIVTIISCKSTKNVAKVDQSNPAKVAESVLNYYKNQDLESLRYLSTHKKAVIIQRIILTKNEAAKQKIFSGWRWDKINQWNGKITEVRFADNLKNAYALFDLPENAGPTSPAIVVTMTSENKKWKFDDIQKYTKQSFEGLGYVME